MGCACQFVMFPVRMLLAPLQGLTGNFASCVVLKNKVVSGFVMSMTGSL